MRDHFLSLSIKTFINTFFHGNLMSEPLLTLKGVTKSFGEKKVLKGINLDIFRGDVFGIIGSSGSGKTTLLNTLIGFYEPDEGDVLIQLPNTKGQPALFSIFKNGNDVMRAFGFSAQKPSFYMKLTVQENMDYFATLYNLKPETKEKNIANLLKLVGLDQDAKALGQNLSGGMQKRLDIACSLVHNPKVLILDEPTADLDPILRKQMWDLIQRINKSGTTIIIASHFLDEIELVATRIGTMHAGDLSYIGAPSDLSKRFSTVEEVHLQTVPGDYKSLMKKLGTKALGIYDVREEGPQIIFKTKDMKKTVVKLLGTLRSSKETMLVLEVHKPYLREIFEKLEK